MFQPCSWVALLVALPWASRIDHIVSTDTPVQDVRSYAPLSSRRITASPPAESPLWSNHLCWQVPHGAPRSIDAVTERLTGVDEPR